MHNNCIIIYSNFQNGFVTFFKSNVIVLLTLRINRLRAAELNNTHHLDEYYYILNSNPLYRLFTLAISILGFFLGWALVLEIILHLFNVLVAGLHLVTFNFSSEPEAKVFLSNYIVPVFGDMNGIILFKFKIINQIINGIILVLGSAFLYYVRIHALGEFTYTELIMQGLNPFKKENRYIDYEERKYKKEKLSKSKKIKESQNFKSNSTDYKKSYNENNFKNNYQSNNDYDKSKSNDKEDLNIEYILACAKLGVDPDDSFEKIKTRYRFIMSNLHPDSTSNSSESTDYIQQINQAYDIIKKYNKK